ncbi:MAG: secretin N-terminal domain-containing protein, partial [Thermodesulfovibrionales bacterium]
QPLVSPTIEPAAATIPAVAAPNTAAPIRPQPAVSRPQPAAAKRAGVKGGDVSFNFDDADVFSVIQTIFGDVLKVNYIVDPNVKGRVNFRSVAPVAKDDVMPLMEVILRLNGIGIVEEGGLYRIIPIADLPKEPAPVFIGREAAKVQITGKAMVQVVPVLFSQSGELTRVLTPFLSKSAVIIDVPKSNYLIIVDTDANVKRLLQLVEIFDSEQLKQVTPQVFVYPVQNSKAKDLAAIIQQIFLGARPTTQAAKTSPQRPGTPAQPAGQPAAQPMSQPQVITGQSTGGDILVAESTRIIPDEITNSIVVLSTPDDYLVIYDTLQKIDIVPRQVMIEALIAEVTLNDTMNFGMQWSIENDLTLKGVKPFTNNINLDGTFNLVSTIASPNFTFVTSALNAANKVKLELQALSGQNRVKILSSPHILVSDNREARIQVGDQVPISTSTTSTTAQAGIQPSITSTIQYKDTGTILKVKPQVNDSGLIALELTQEVSDFSTQSLFGSDQIIISKREATTNLVAQDGQTIVIGGLIKEKITKGRSGLPFLSKIPVLGYLFGSTTDVNDRTELIILLTPHVVRNEADARDVTSGYIKRLQGIKDIDIKRNEVIMEKRGTGK